MESGDASTDRVAAAAELAALQADRAAMAERIVQPWWYDVLLGLLTFGFLASYATRDVWIVAGAAVLFFAGLWGLTRVFRRLTGVWISGDRPGPTQRTLKVWLGCCIGWAVAAGCAMAFDLPELVLAASAVCGVAVALISRWWTRIYVAELRGEL